jgi:pimeloyl-ACP methyl ester carboxylesterase
MYQATHPSTSRFLPIRTHRYHLREWGVATPDEPTLVMVHGWMDVGASFQFMADELHAQGLAPAHIVAPDWRGYGLTTGPQADSYWFHDYVADLDAIIHAVSPGRPVYLLGHSLGGHVSMNYAGVRPERIAKLVNLEGFGMPQTLPAQSPTRIGRWLDELQSFHDGGMALRGYDSSDGVARRLMKNNPRLRQDRAQWLAQHWAAPDESGQWNILGDAAHKLVNPILSRAEEIQAIYQRITAPALVVVAEHSHEQVKQWWGDRYSIAEFDERLKQVPQCTRRDMPDAAHMLHHDQPEALATMVGEFLRG